MLEMTSSNSKDTLDCEGNETPKTIFQILYNTFHISSLCRLPQWKSSVLNCTTYSSTKEMYITLCFTCLLWQ